MPNNCRFLASMAIAACSDNVSDRPPSAPPAALESSASSPTSKPFNRGAAAAALGRVDLRECAPTDSGHVTVIFGSDGNVTSAVLDGGALVGTAAAGCIEAKYRGVSIPPFAGNSVYVGKSFSGG